ncbi:pilus assembly PilX family protein [Sphaerotilus uruguayifluvii]|uniref:Tfp pilus assembly protein PilX n=1 Tax=Sphaerotilus uruguayifluvii TaxID=2735897 RepID=A0ABX2FZI6_9BURK|nr:hypothetical protein [Leptothrix sp. C29]NRT55214.1 Tfp pilus assembly protein PilX [Leptothrix sp. C29]
MSAPARLPTRRRQRGMVLLFTLVALTVVLLAGLSLIRALDVSLLQAGNLGYRRDLANQADRGMAQAVALISSGALSTESARNASLGSANYSASRLATNAQGIPLVLLSDAAFTAAGMSGADLVDSASGVTVRWVIDRQCLAAGDVLGTACALDSSLSEAAADDRYRLVRSEVRAVMRISVRATGPRGTQAFFQSVVTR